MVVNYINNFILNYFFIAVGDNSSRKIMTSKVYTFCRKQSKWRIKTNDSVSKRDKTLKPLRADCTRVNNFNCFRVAIKWLCLNIRQIILKSLIIAVANGYTQKKLKAMWGVECSIMMKLKNRKVYKPNRHIGFGGLKW
jgi:hypothetical protein